MMASKAYGTFGTAEHWAAARLILKMADLIIVGTISTTDERYAKLTELVQDSRYDTLYGAVQYLCNIIDLSRKEDLQFALRRKVVAEALHALDAQGIMLTSVVQGWASMVFAENISGVHEFAEKLWGTGPKADLFVLLEEHSFGDEDRNEMETAERELHDLCQKLETIWAQM